MAVQLLDNSVQGRTNFLTKWGVDGGVAQRVANNESQFQAYLRDFTQGITRATQDAERSVGGYFNALNSTKSDMTDARKEAERQNILSRGTSGQGLKGELNDAYAFLTKMKDYLTPDTIDSFNTLLASAEQIDSSLKFTAVEGGTGYVGTSQDLVDKVTSPGTGKNDTDTSSSTRSASEVGTTEYKIGLLEDAISRLGDPTGARQAEIDKLRGGTTGGGTDSTTDTSSTGTTDTGTQSMPGTTFDSRKQSAIDYINSQDLPADLKSLYITAVQNWDPNTELNPESIIKAFQDIKSSTIDPRFQGLANIAINSVKNASESMIKQRQIELESEAANYSQAIGDTQASLESRGLTSSGEGVKQLGTNLSGTIKFGGEQQVEGLVNQQNRLISTSSDARYLQNVKDLGLQAEEQLGTSRVNDLVPGYIPAGSVVGSLTESKQAAEGATLGNILNQQITNKSQNELSDYSSYV